MTVVPYIFIVSKLDNYIAQRRHKRVIKISKFSDVCELEYEHKRKKLLLVLCNQVQDFSLKLPDAHF